MLIVLIGQAAFGEKVLQTLVTRGEEIAGVYMPSDSPGKPNSFKELAKQTGIPVFQPKRMRDPQVYTDYIKLKADLNVMAFVTDIIPEVILKYPRLGSIQYHPSLLPKHRGGSSINWAVINGETKTGITIFWPDKGIDTGPILLQKEVDISPDDTVGSLYFNKLFSLGVDALVESIELIKKGTATRIPQDESQATYEGLCTQQNTIIKWQQPAGKVYNLIRGANPQPGATTNFQNKQFKVFDSELRTGSAGSLPGNIIDITKQGFWVAAIDGAILIKRLQPEGSPKIASFEFAEQLHLKVGDRLS